MRSLPRQLATAWTSRPNRIASIGAATGAAVARAGGVVIFTPDIATAAALADELPIAPGAGSWWSAASSPTGGLRLGSGHAARSSTR